ncbi:hypothetical protein COK01_26820 [Priestia megaterium]|uniref:VOC family protein n=1 Tax=Priestia megaterium TaxID=1404 RepID=UPI000BF78127|nr:VOC family protein [Priestia megaterium]PFP44701.1 hypothetical protein COK01_26820 [Priestia megaterium]
MGNPVTFFEITGKNSKELAKFYSEIFGWNIIPPQGSMEYRIMDTDTQEGIPGAIGDPIGGDDTWLTIYITVPDIDSTLEKIKQNGGKIKIPKFTTDTGFTLAYVEDAFGHTLGITQSKN